MGSDERWQFVAGYPTDGTRLDISVALGPSRDGPVLSIVGDVYELYGRRWRDVGGGQCTDTLRALVDTGMCKVSHETLVRLLAVWERWHLNHMRPGCEHQRAEGWGENRINGQLSQWLRESEGGVLEKACPVCGYRYGTRWLYEPLPDDVLTFIRGLPGKRGSDA